MVTAFPTRVLAELTMLLALTELDTATVLRPSVLSSVTIMPLDSAAFWKVTFPEIFPVAVDLLPVSPSPTSAEHENKVHRKSTVPNIDKADKSPFFISFSFFNFRH